MSRVFKSAKWNSISTATTIIISMLQLMILTRQLPIEVFGQFAVLNLIIIIFTSLSLGGISNYLIYKNNLSQQGKNSVYFLALCLGIFCMVSAYILSPYILMLFGYSSLSEILKILSVLLLISAISAQYQALAIKIFAHKATSQIDIFSNLIGFSLAMLTINLELMCLVIATIGTAISRMLLLMICFSSKINLSTNISIKEVKLAFDYGKYNIGGQLLNIIRQQVDMLILSIMLPVNELGVYHVIKQLASRPGQAIQPILSKIAMPLFSEKQNSLINLKRSYLDMLITFSFILAFIYTPLIILSEPIIFILFGQKYVEYHLVLTLLSCFWYVRVSGPTTMGALIQATGKTKLTFYWNLALLPISVVVMLSAASHGIYAVGFALLFLQLFLLPLSNQLIVRKVIDVKTKEQLIATLMIISLFLFPLIVIKGFYNYFDLGLISSLSAIILAGTSQIIVAVILYKKIPFFKEPLTRLKKA